MVDDLSRKLDYAADVLETLDYRLNRFAPVTYADDASWVETKHPRDADGKFSSGSGGAGSAGHGAKAYDTTLKKGVKGSAAGLIKFMLEKGTYGKSDIETAALNSYGVKPASIPWYLNDIKKKTGLTAPSKSSPPDKGGGEASELENFKLNEPAQTAKPMTSGTIPPSIKSDIKSLVASNHMTADAANNLLPVIEHWDNLTAENKPKVEKKINEILDALTSKYEPSVTVAKLQPLAGAGMSVNAVNSAIEKLKAQHGVSTASVSAYTPTTVQEKAVYTALKAVPHYRQDHVNYFEDASGKEVRAVLKTDTRKIQGDHFASVSSAYNEKPENGNTEAVGKAMQGYGHEQYETWTQDQKSALSSYKGSGYHDINKYMRGVGVEYAYSEVIDKVKHIREAMKTSVVPADTPVWRGLDSSLKQLTGFDDPTQAVGRCFVHQNFASVSRSKQVSSGFGTKTLLKFTIPAGANGIVLGSQNSGEKEIVLPDHAVFRVTKVEGNMVHVDYLGSKQDE